MCTYVQVYVGQCVMYERVTMRHCLCLENRILKAEFRPHPVADFDFANLRYTRHYIHKPPLSPLIDFNY